MIVKVHFDYIDPNGGRHTRFVGDGVVINSTSSRFLIEVTHSEVADLSVGDTVWVPKRNVGIDE